MASVVAFNVYQIDSVPVRQGETLYLAVGFPCDEIFAQETNITVSGVQMNAFIIWGQKQYYVEETVAEIETAANAGGGGSSYLVYTATFSQVNTAPIVVNELQNDLGSNTVNSSAGFYSVVFDNVDFDATKTWVGGIDSPNASKYISIPVTSGAALLGYALIYYGDLGGGKLGIEVDTCDASFTPVDFSALFGSNGVLCLPEIRVYP